MHGEMSIRQPRGVCEQIPYLHGAIGLSSLIGRCRPARPDSRVCKLRDEFFYRVIEPNCTVLIEHHGGGRGNGLRH